MTRPTLYFVSGPEENNTFHISAKKYQTNSDEWESNNVELKAIWFASEEAAFNTFYNICNQAGIQLLRDM